MSSPSYHPSPTCQPRIIIHGGAGNITRANLPPASWHAYRNSLLTILRTVNHSLLTEPCSDNQPIGESSGPATALDAATHAVRLLEDDPLFNCGHGAVFTRSGTNELEASVMVSNLRPGGQGKGYIKRGVGVMMLTHVKNPILLAKEMLVKGDDISEGGNGGGAGGHVQLSGEEVERLAGKWGVEKVEREYFWTQWRWAEHLRGLEREKREREQRERVGVYGLQASAPERDHEAWAKEVEEEYLPQGTVGCVVLDCYGTLCVATSTGGLTNKLPGRIGDTPTLGAGFWAEDWVEDVPAAPAAPALASAALSSLASRLQVQGSPLAQLLTQSWSKGLRDCLPFLPSLPLRSSSSSSSSPSYTPLPLTAHSKSEKPQPARRRRRAVAMSGTGNGDSFLKLSAARTTASICRFSTPSSPLASAVTRVAGPGGELQASTGQRWGKTGEGEGGIVGIEYIEDADDGDGKEGVSGRGEVTADFNCGGMFTAWVDKSGRERCKVFKDDY
ncbi:MAG: hypothetical protein M1827_007745 [Pycnora praestabilis]|nr:MAG: hypothetical protein M1827_007745 [Pycnora praestabilis]